MHAHAERGQRLVLGDIQVGDAQQRAAAGGDVDDRRQRLRGVQRAVARLGGHRARADRIRVAAAIQQEVLILHVGEGFRVEGHADEVKRGVEAVDLDRVLDVVPGRAIAVVVGILCAHRKRARGGRSDRDWCGRLAGAEDVGAGGAVRAGILAGIGVAGHKAGAQGDSRRRSGCAHPILPGTHVELADHAHLQVLGGRDMAVPEVGAGIRSQVVIREAAADVDGNRGVWHTVVECRSVRVTVEVDSVLLEQVGPHYLADVREREEEFVVFVYGHERRRHVGVHHTDVHDQARIDVAVDRIAGHAGIRSEADGPVEVIARCDGACGLIDRSADENRVDAERGVVDIEQLLHFGARLSICHIGEARERAEAEQIRLRAITHGGITVAARDLLALDAPAHRIRCRIGRIGRVRRSRTGALHAETLRGCRQREQSQYCCGDSAAEKTCTKHKASVRNFRRARRSKPWRKENLARCVRREYHLKFLCKASCSAIAGPVTAPGRSPWRTHKPVSDYPVGWTLRLLRRGT